MSSDLNSMTATGLLAWLRAAKDPISVTDLMIVVAAGITDTHLIDKNRAGIEGARDELRALTARGRRQVRPPLDVDDLDLIAAVGNAVYLHDRDNLDAWHSLATLIDQVEPEVRMHTWRPRFRSIGRWTAEATRMFISELLDVGRGPLYGRELVERAVETGVSPDSYGYWITSGVFSDLAKAGVGGAELDRLAENGIDRDEAIDLIGAGIPAGAIVAAISQGIPRERWATLLSGMNPDWFRMFDLDEYHRLDPIDHGILSRRQEQYKAQGWTWKHLRRLVDAGWNDVITYSLRSVRYGQGRAGGSLSLDADMAVRIAEAGIGYAEFARWLGAFAERSRTDYVPEHVKKPLFYIARSNLDEIIAAILAVKAAKIAPSSITDYRWSGCSSVDDVLTAATAGINGPRVKYLRGRYGQQRSRHESKYFANVRELLHVHVRDLASDQRSA